MYYSDEMSPKVSSFPDPSIDDFSPLCRYLDIPDQLDDMVQWLTDEAAWKRYEYDQ